MKPQPDYFALAARLARAAAVTTPAGPLPSMYITYTDAQTGARVTVHAVDEAQIADIVRRRRKEEDQP